MCVDGFALMHMAVVKENSKLVNSPTVHLFPALPSMGLLRAALVAVCVGVAVTVVDEGH